MPPTGRTWHIKFEDPAKNAGSAKITWKVKKSDGTTGSVPGSWDYAGGETAAQKAQRFYDALTTTYAAYVTASKSGNTVTFTLKSDNPDGFTDIEGLDIDSTATGEKHTWMDDGDPILMELTILVYVAGGPIDLDGKISVRIGPTNPLLEVATCAGGQPRPTPAIVSELVSTFNNLYSGTGYSAVLTWNGLFLVAAVPCNAGLTCGSSDGFTGCVCSLIDQ